MSAPVRRQWRQHVSLRPSSTPASAGSSLTKRGGPSGDAKGRSPYRRHQPPSKLPKSSAELSLAVERQLARSVRTRNGERYDWRAALNPSEQSIADVRRTPAIDRQNAEGRRGADRQIGDSAG